MVPMGSENSSGGFWDGSDSFTTNGSPFEYRCDPVQWPIEPTVLSTVLSEQLKLHRQAHLALFQVVVEEVAILAAEAVQA